MDGHRPKLPVNKNCYGLSRVSWALAQISCYFTHNQKHFTRRSPMTQKLSLDLLRFYAHGQLRESGPPQPVALMGEAYIFFKQNVSGNEGLLINAHMIPWH